MIYLDNAATSFEKPNIVKQAVNEALEKYTANPGRSAHNLSIDVAIKVFEARERVKQFFNAESEERVVFTPNCTTALNYAIFGSIKEGGHVITTAFEHNSVLRPLFELQRQRKIDLTILYPDKDGYFLPESFEKSIKKNTYMIIVNHISNVTGTMQKIGEIGAICKKYNLLYIVDAAQSAGHKKIDMQADNIDILCFAGHKGTFGICGSGAMVCSNKVILKPHMFGGTGAFSAEVLPQVTFPESFECGTVSTIPIISLSEGINYVANNFGAIQQKLDTLTDYLIEKIENLPIQKLYYKNNCHGVLSFNFENIDSGYVGDILNEKYDICVRTGLHCAPLVHQYFDTIEQGAVRVSIGYFNSKEDIDALYDALTDIYKSSAIKKY